MRSKGWISVSRFVFAMFVVPMWVCVASTPAAWGQTDEGAPDLDKAFQAKIDVSSLKDLDGVVKLCESALEKGLDADGTEQANQLAASALLEHAEKLTARGMEDPRWRIHRSQALAKLKKAVKFQPKMGEAFLLIAKLNGLQGGDNVAARAAVEKAVELAGDDRVQLSTALFLRASLAEDDEAQLADLNQAIKINPDNIQAVRVRAAYYLRKREPENALEDLNKWLESDDQNATNYLTVAQQLMLTGSKFDESLQREAIRIIDKAIEINPDKVEPYTLRATIYQGADKFEEAIKDANRAVELDPKRFDVLLLRASILSDQEKLDEALEDVNLALELQPGLINAIQIRGMILSQQQKFPEAIEDIKKLASNDRNNLFFQRQLAMLYNANDEPSRAIKIYERLLRADPKGSWDGKSVRRQLGILLRRAASLRGQGDAQLSSGKHAEAVKSFDEALELGLAIQEIEESEGAEELSKLDDGVLNNLAWVLATSPDENVRDGKRAIELATQAAELTEFKQAHILSTLASGYAESGDFENAIKWIEKAIEINKEAGEAAVDKSQTDKQRESLHKEYENYKKQEPWREMQNVEEEKSEAEGDKADDGESDDDKAGGDKDDDKEKDDDKKDDDKGGDF